MILVNFWVSERDGPINLWSPWLIHRRLDLNRIAETKPNRGFSPHFPQRPQPSWLMQVVAWLIIYGVQKHRSQWLRPCYSVFEDCLDRECFPIREWEGSNATAFRVMQQSGAPLQHSRGALRSAKNSFLSCFWPL